MNEPCGRHGVAGDLAQEPAFQPGKAIVVSLPIVSWFDRPIVVAAALGACG